MMTSLSLRSKCWSLIAEWSAHRSVDVAGIALLALQKGPKTEQAGAWYGRAPMINIGAEIADYDDTMAILDNLDLLVRVDTSVAHLAGAMGHPVWIMLPRAPDWRWLLDRSNTPWYPSARLFRQQNARRWDDVVQAIGEELNASLRQDAIGTRCDRKISAHARHE